MDTWQYSLLSVSGWGLYDYHFSLLYNQTPQHNTINAHFPSCKGWDPIKKEYLYTQPIYIYIYCVYSLFFMLQKNHGKRREILGHECSTFRLIQNNLATKRCIMPLASFCLRIYILCSLLFLIQLQFLNPIPACITRFALQIKQTI